MPELKWLELARADLFTIVDYISDDNSDAKQRVKDDIEKKIENLPEFPKMGRPGRLRVLHTAQQCAAILIETYLVGHFFIKNVNSKLLPKEINPRQKLTSNS